MIKSILAIIAAFAKWFTGDRQETKRDQAEVEKRKRETLDAINARDEERVNNILHRHLLCVILPVCFLAGCRTAAPAPIYISAEDKVLAIEWQGKPGWFVPDNVYKAIMLKLEEKGK